MKTFWATALLFLALIGVIAWNTCFLQRAADGLELRLQALTEEADIAEKLDELERYWTKKRPVLELSLPADQLAQIQERIAVLRGAAAARDGRFWEAYTLLGEALERLRDAERLSIANLL